MAPASPIPTPMRQNSSTAKFRACEAKPPKPEKTAMEIAMIRARLRRSASRAIGKPMSV